MNLSPPPFRALILTLALAAPTALLPAQAPIERITPPLKDATPVVPKPKPRRPKTPPGQPPAFNPTLILLDPAHGGSDPGAQIAPDLPEKQVTLDFARRLRPLLAARGFTVVLTREGDPVAQPAPAPASNPDPANPDGPPAPPAPPPPPPAQITPDQRAELANRIHPVACILLHATSAGHGIHLYTSALTPPLASETPHDILLWDTAQGPALANSARLTTILTEAINGLRIPLVTGQASVRPIDSMTCPAVLLELAPLAGSTPTPVSDAAYQQRVAEAVVSALTVWHGQAESILAEQAAFAARAAERAAATGAPAQKPAEKPKPRPKPAPGALLPNAPAPLPTIPKIPQIVAPKPSIKQPPAKQPSEKSGAAQ